MVTTESNMTERVQSFWVHLIKVGGHAKLHRSVEPQVEKRTSPSTLGSEGIIIVEVVIWEESKGLNYKTFNFFLRFKGKLKILN